MLARAIPGLLGFAGLAVYSRILTPTDYGYYAVILALVGLGNSLIFVWIRVGVVRFLSGASSRSDDLLASLLLGYFISCGVALLVTLPTIIGFKRVVPSFFAPLTFLILCARAWYDLNLEYARSQLQPRRYTRMSILKAALTLAVGIPLAIYWGSVGALVGVLFALSLATASGFKDWLGVRPAPENVITLRRLARYGLPLTATFAFTFLVNTSDRLIIAWLLGPGPAGEYSVGYDLAQQSILVLMMAVNLAGYPLAIAAFEKQNAVETSRQLSNNFVGLLAVGLPTAVGLSLFAPNITNVLLGDDFRQTAAHLLPWIVIGTLVMGIKAYYFDLSFLLQKRTMPQVWITFVAALTNIALNIVWLPDIGLLGAAYATVISYSVGLLLSWHVGKKVHPLPIPFVETTKILVATAITAVAVWPLRHLLGPIALLVQLTLASTLYVALAMGMNVLDLRCHLTRMIGRVQGRSGSS